MDGPLLIDADDPKMVECYRIAEALLEACRRVGMAGAQDRGQQALYFAGVSVMNVAKMDPYDVLYALGGVVGAAAGLCEGPDAAILVVADIAQRYIEDTRQKALLTDSEPQGHA